MWALNAWLPVLRLVPAPWNRLGIVLIAGGIAFGMWGASHFRRRQTALRPFTEAAQLVTDGPFRISRNVMYLGLGIALAGFALLFGSLSPWLALPLYVWAIQTCVIRVEEEMLDAKFGPAFAQYKSQVRRWL
jgi:protein-S-isoprenylcysteine O-methyltransferase Ste14